MKTYRKYWYRVKFNNAVEYSMTANGPVFTKYECLTTYCKDLLY